MSTEQLYLRDLGLLLREMALAAQGEKSRATACDFQYALGRLTAMQEVISVMQQQARVFGIEFETIGLHGLDAEKDLL
jgi:hypothetical protein